MTTTWRNNLMNHILQALKSLGGSGTNEQIKNKVVEIANIPSEKLEVLHDPEKGGVTEIEFRLGWAKSYLKRYGIIENLARGLWALTPKGSTTEKVDEKAVDLFVKEQIKKNKQESIDFDGLTERQIGTQLRTVLAASIEPQFGPLKTEGTWLVSADANHRILSRYNLGKNKWFYGVEEKDWKNWDNSMQLAFIMREEKNCGFLLLTPEESVNLLKNISPAADRSKKINIRKRSDGVTRIQEWRELNLDGRLLPLELPNAINDKISISKNVWWVNQRDNIQQERDNSIIWAPIKDKADKSRYYWDTLKEVSPGDTILHYAKGFLRYVSCAKSRAQDITRPNDLKGYDAFTLGRSVELEYHKLQHLVPLSKIKDSLRDIEITQGPLDKNGNIKQGYLFRLTPEAFSLIRKASPNTSWPSCLESNNQPSDQPKPDDGNTGKEKPDIPLNLILYGPPGTGKTCSLLEYAKKWFQTGEEKRWRMVTFHQSYGYEDFVEGLKPKVTSGQVTYDIFDGIFKQIVTAAMADHSKSFALLVDEINRANISKVFGELIKLLEKGKRLEWREESGKWEGDYRVKLPYTHTLKPDTGEFGVPDNLYVIGTMNTADRSIALLDTALRRRFDFRELMPDLERLTNKKILVENDEIDMKELLNAINLRISAIYDREHQIGTSYFEDVTDLERLEKVFLNQIIPLLQEYFFDDWDKIKIVLNDLGDASGAAIIETIVTSNVFSKSVDEHTIRPVYKMPTKITAAQIKRIYA